MMSVRPLPFIELSAGPTAGVSVTKSITGGIGGGTARLVFLIPGHSPSLGVETIGLVSPSVSLVTLALTLGFDW